MPQLLLATVAALLVATAAVAQPSPIAAKEAEARQVVDQINALDTSLDRSNELVNLANVKLAQVQKDIALNKRELVIARHNLLMSQRTIARRLVTLYRLGSTSPLEVILGGQSLEDVLNRIDTENRVTSLDAKVANQVATYRTSVLRHRVQLGIQREQVRKLVARRAAERRTIEARLGERRQLLGSLNGEVARLIAAQQARELKAAQAARLRSADVQSQASEAFNSATVGATASTPEGAVVVPPSSYSGVVGVAMQELGVPYVWAGSSPSGFDCSGLVMYAYSKVGISLPHSSYAMWNVGVSVPRDQLQPGDLVFFSGLGHVGIYLGGGEYVHAPHSGTVVSVSSLDSSSYVGARRVL